jgi:hypothetical protein
MRLRNCFMCSFSGACIWNAIPHKRPLVFVDRRSLLRASSILELRLECQWSRSRCGATAHHKVVANEFRKRKATRSLLKRVSNPLKFSRDAAPRDSR